MSNTVSRTITDQQLNKIIQIESAGKPTIKARTSSATGFGQFIDQTWLGILKKYGPADVAQDIVKSRTTGKWIVPKGSVRQSQILNMRKATTPELMKLNIDMLARFTEDNAKGIGAGFTDGDLYLAHFLGLDAARKLYRAGSSTPVSSILTGKSGQAAIRANRSILSGKTAGQVRQWAQTSMDSRWARAGKPDWIKKYYPEPSLSLIGYDEVENFDEAPVKVEDVSDETFQPPGWLQTSQDNLSNSIVWRDRMLKAGVSPHADVQIFEIQWRLKALKYSPGGLDGLWGGMIAGAIAGFMNDSALQGLAPTSIEDFRSIYPDLVGEITIWEQAGKTRPVSEKRAELTEATVEKVEPAAAPVRQNFLTSVWLAITGFFAGIIKYFQSAFDWLVGDGDDSRIGTVVSFFQHIPTTVWFVAFGVLFLVIAINSKSSLTKITQDVKTGERI